MWKLFMEYWELGLLIGTWLAIASLTARRRLDWRRARFVDAVNFSLNYLEPLAGGGVRLAVRTLLEDTARRVWLNEWGVARVIRAAQRTTRERPFLVVEPTRDRKQVERGVLNVLAERFADVFLARALELPVRCEPFLIGLTWERYGEVHSEKLRVMVVRPRHLERLFEEGAAEVVELESETHAPRLQTLREMHRLWRSADPDERSRIGHVELGVMRAEPAPVELGSA